MSSNDPNFNADANFNRRPGSGSDIKLPPISFLSGTGNKPNNLPTPSNIGIPSFLSHENKHYSSNSPDASDEHTDKKLKVEDDVKPNDHHSPDDKSTSTAPIPSQFNTTSQSPYEPITNKEHEQSGTVTQQHSHDNHGYSHSRGHSHSHHNPHHHHHRHHHHHVHNNGAEGDSTSGVPHIHNGNHIQLLPHLSKKASEEAENPEKVIEHNDGQSNQIEARIENDQQQAPNAIEKVAESEQGAQYQITEDQENLKRQDVPASVNDPKDTNPSAVEERTPVKSRPLTINKDEIVEILAELFPSRHNLGTLVYNPTTTWSTLQTSQLTGLKPEHHERYQQIKEDYAARLKEEYFRLSSKYIPMIPPFANDYINHLLEIKIPYKFIKLFKEELDEGQIPLNRAIWGGASGVYTDDSDVLLALAHLGFFNGAINLKEWNNKWVPSDIIVPLSAKEDSYGLLGDLSVTLLLLPSLPEYHGYYANGINPRLWVSYKKHNGLSYAIFNVKWEGQGSYLIDKSLFKKYRSELSDDTKTSKEELSSKKGWCFNYPYYKEIKDKIQNLDKPEKDENPKDETASS